MNTSGLDKRAENYVAAKIESWGFLPAKPYADVNGADLLIIGPALKDGSKFLRCQVKGRSFLRPTHVEVRNSYVTPSFVLLLFEKESERLYLFSDPDIRSDWKLSVDGSRYRLAVTQRNLPNMSRCEVNADTPGKITRLLATVQNELDYKWHVADARLLIPSPSMRIAGTVLRRGLEESDP